MKFFLNKDVPIELISQKVEDIASLIFGSEGSIVAFGGIKNFSDINSMIDNTIGSEKWFSEDSDLFRFERNGTLNSIILSVPPRNILHCPVFPGNEVGRFSLQLVNLNQSFIVQPKTVRFFDAKKRELYCFDEHKKNCKLKRFLVASDFSLLFDDQNLFAGWILANPIEKITSSFQDFPPLSVVDQYTYDVFFDFFNLFSDNQCEQNDDDMCLVVQNLCEVLNENRLKGIVSEKHRSLIIQVINELRDYFF